MTDRKVITKDGSATYYSEEYGESYHSLSGAMEEADKKYAQVCGIGEREDVVILDICFGLGYNSAAAIDAFNGSSIRIVGLESYQGIIDEISRMGDEYPFKCHNIMKQIASEGNYEDEKTYAKLIMGDARETIKSLKKDSFDCVFLDPFSPNKCPELWTKEFFEKIYRVMKKGGVLTTYSCARIVRDNLTAAGFNVRDGPVVGRRGPGTVAVKDQA
ncbi:hypothetical protein HQ545_00415 [Candidatus Woesearchaeota archaeon]|nr:hypothetical protein [Candidatus Woesearchaeota archaeon]